MSLKIYYDGECPFCTRYVKFLKLRKAAGQAELVDLRQYATLRAELENQGFDLDQGMVVETDGRRVGGADAVNALALISTPSDTFNRLNIFLLSSEKLAALIYPILRSGRWLTLFLLGRDGLKEEDRGMQDRAAIFSCFFALFSIFHFFNYTLEYGRLPPQLDQMALLVSALILFWKPYSPRALFLLILISTISTVVQAPIPSNHTMVRSAALLGYWAAFFYAMARSLRWSEVFANFALAGRGALLVMYFFGIFHKINTDFLNPETSCAVALWRLMPMPLSALDFPLMHYVTIYGTFVAEGLLLVALLVPRVRHYAIVGGILFHMLLALSSYAMYISFTTLSIALHVLFLSNEGASRIMQSPEMAFVRKRLSNPIFWVLGLAYIVTLALYALLKEYTAATLATTPIVLPFCYMVIRYGAPSETSTEPKPGRPAIVIGAVVTVLFTINCLMPYFGLKTAQAINMFANLQLEGNTSNHLVFRNPPGPFTYLNDVAIFDDTGEDGLLKWTKEREFGWVYYDLLAYLQSKPELIISFSVGEKRYEDVSAAELKDDIDSTLHSAWFRKWFHFQPVKLLSPEPCNN